MHRGAQRQGYEPVIRSMGRVVLDSGRIVGALGVLENEDHEVAAVRAAPPDRLVAVEEEAQVLAKRLHARLPFSRIGLLIVDELGKDISGAGMDCKVIGRNVPFDPALMPEINLIYVRDLTPASEGNGVGVGLADLMHEQLYRKLDLRKVYINAQTALDPAGARLPMHFSSGLAGDRICPGRDGQHRYRTRKHRLDQEHAYATGDACLPGDSAGAGSEGGLSGNPLSLPAAFRQWGRPERSLEWRQAQRLRGPHTPRFLPPNLLIQADFARHPTRFFFP